MKYSLKTITITLLMIFSSNPAQSQNAKLDSLDRLIRNETDEKLRINHMLEKADLLAIINLDSAISFNLKIIDASKQINFGLGQEEAMLKLVHNYTYAGNSAAALRQLSGLRRYVEQTGDSGSFANYYSTAGLYYGMQSLYDSSIYFYEKEIGRASCRERV